MQSQPVGMTDPDVFSKFIADCWKAHTKRPAAVRSRLQRYRDDAMTEPQLIELSALVCHIAGEHLGDWAAGTDHYRLLSDRFPILSEATRRRLRRQLAILEMAQDPERSFDELSLADRFYVTALALPAAALQIDAAQGRRLFLKALELLSLLDREPSSCRLLAIVTANLTCDILERYELPSEMKALLVLVAEASRDLWSKLGTSEDRERAEYRLAMSCLRVREPIGNESGRYPRSRSVEP